MSGLPIWMQFGLTGLAGFGLGYLIAFALGRRVAEDLLLQRDTARTIAKAYLQRMREADCSVSVRRDDDRLDGSV